MRKRLRTFTIIMVLMSLFGAACAQDDGGEAQDGEREVSFDLTIGMVTSFTGDLSDFGRPVETAGQVAVEIINESLEEANLSGDITVSFASEDDQTSAQAGVEAANKLIDSEGANVIVGALASSVTTPVAQSATVPKGVVQISPASTSPALTELEDNNLFWRTVPSDALQGQVLADAMAEAFGADATINTGTRNDAYGTALTGAFEQAWRDGGGTIGASVRWNPEATTFDAEAAELASGSPDGWMIIDFPETWAKVGPALVRTGNWDPALTFTADGLKSTELPTDVGAEATNGMRGTAPTATGATAADAFDAAFKERAPQGVGRQTFDAQAFDAVMVAFLAAVAAGSSDPADIAAELQDVSGPGGTEYTFEELGDAIDALLAGDDIDYQGASGPIDFDDNGDPGGAFYEVWQFTDGQIQTLDTTSFGV